MSRNVPTAVLAKLGDVQTGLASEDYERDDLRNDLDTLFEICAACGGVFDGSGDGEGESGGESDE